MANEIERLFTAIDLKADDRVKKTVSPKVVYGTDNMGSPKLYDLDSLKGQIVRFNLTGQMDGETQTFIIDESITSETDTFITYQGIRFEKGYHYTIDYVTHELTTMFENPPDSDNGRMLFLFSGSDVSGISGSVNDVIVNGSSVVSGGIAHIDMANYISEQEWIDDDIELTRAAALAQFQSNPSLMFVFIAKQQE